MRLFIKTVKNIKFDIQVQPEDKVYDAKKIIETAEHEDIYPAPEQKLIYHGKVLDDETTFTENNITEDSSLVTMRKGWDGISALELIHMRYIGNDVMPEEQLGTITMIVDDIAFDLYYEENIDMSMPSIKFGDYIPAVGIGPICYELKLVFYNLFGGAFKDSIELSTEDFRYGEGLMKRSIKSVNSNGIIQALFCYLNNATVATVATVEVQLLNNMSASATISVYGVISSTNSQYDELSSLNILFLQKPTASIEVCSTEEEHVGVIPLSKSRVAVPLGSVMYVDISLSCDDKDYQGTAYFDAFMDGTDSQVVADYFLVKVNWNCKIETPILEEHNSEFDDSDTSWDDY